VSNVPKAPGEPGIPIPSGASHASIDSLDFERADRTTRVCAQCGAPIADRYYTLGAHVLCESCQLAFRNARVPGNAATRFFGAAALGTLAAAIGCALWMLVTELTGYEIGLIAIAVGYVVGLAVHVGARRVGGPVYQCLAAFLTYTAIAMTYVPMIASQMISDEGFQPPTDSAHSEFWTPEGSPERAGGPGAQDVEGADRTAAAGGGEDPEAAEMNARERAVLAWIAAVPIAYALPFLMGFENAIGILIIGFALWQAFRMNARARLELHGPFRFAARDPALG